MKKIKLTIEYDGTNFHGWQIQSNLRTVQGEIENALKIITGKETHIVGASRTDAGVHALGNVAHFTTDSKLEVNKFIPAINALTGDDLSITQAVEVSHDFHARYSAKGKIYAYQIWQGYSSLRRTTHLLIKKRLDVDAMIKAASFLLGYHNFNAFRAADCDKPDPCLELKMCKVMRGIPEEQIVICVAAPFFLKHMVRIIAGTLIETGKGKIKPADIPLILESKKRELAGPTAPPNGLILLKVFY